MNSSNDTSGEIEIEFHHDVETQAFAHDDTTPIPLVPAVALAEQESSNEWTQNEESDNATANVVVTLVGSNDSSSVRIYQEAPAASSEAVNVKDIPKYGVGCIAGLVRDCPFWHIFLLLVGAGYLNLSLNSQMYRDGSRDIPIELMIVWFIIFLLEAILCGDGKALRNMHSNKEVVGYLNQLYRTEPQLNLQVECYHFQQRTEYYRDGNGKLQTRMHTIRITTFRGREPVHILSCRDATQKRLTEADLHEYQLTKVELTKNFVADASFSRQYERFEQRHRHLDVHYDLSVNFDIPDFRSNLLSYVSDDEVHCLVGWHPFFLCHLLILPALPYRLWLSSRTSKQRVEIQKHLSTAPPYDLPRCAEHTPMHDVTRGAEHTPTYDAPHCREHTPMNNRRKKTTKVS